MLRNFRRFVLALALAAVPMILVPVQAHAQWWGYGQNGQNNTEQRAYQAGYNNGVNDANKGKAMNLGTGKWNGANLQAYQRGYETGYGSQARNTGGYRNNGGYNNGGYYGGGRDRDGDRDRDRNQGSYSYGGYGQNNNVTQQAYQAGYNNGVNDRNRGKALNTGTGKWNGVNRQAYERGYEAGYRSAGGRGGYRR